MKRLIFLIIFFITSQFLYSQVYKSGTISSPETWDGTVYISGDITINSTVTINAGTRVLFKGNNLTLTVNGAGIMNANGTSGNMVYFSADDNENGSYGETGERGLKIRFYPTSSNATSTLDNCIIEYIDCSAEAGAGAYGAIDIISGTVFFNNCLIRNNKSDYGGAIFLRSSSKLTLNNSILDANKADNWGGGIYFGAAGGSINNCVFKNNSASSGGAIYVYQGSPSITNCLIYNNSASGAGSGIYFNGAYSSCKIINATITKNNSSGSALDFGFTGQTGKVPSINNSIIWGTNIGTLNSSLISIVNSAIQGFSNPGDHANSFSLSSDNDDSNGPHFAATDGSDWSIKLISPCRDAGSTPSPAIDYDYIGNPRVGPYDIGAYEVQYSRWKTTAASTDWGTSGNWEGGIPTNSTDVVIPTGALNYPTGSAAQDFTIGAGKQMIIEQGGRVTLDDLTNNGIIKLNHNATGFASLIINSYTRGTGATEEIQLYLAGGGTSQLEDYKWHYISTPVSTLSTNVFTGATLDLAQYIESRVVATLQQGWVAFDGYDYSTGSTTSIKFSSLTPGKGYDFWDDANNTFTFGGLFNTSDVAMPLSFTSIPSKHGFNLLGNPFSSGLDWDQIANSTYFPYPSSTSKAAFFTQNNTQCTYVNGVGTPLGVTGIIPPMQGFFVKTHSTGNTITLPKAARTNSNIHDRYKGESVIPLVRISLSNNTTSFDDAVVRFDDAAKSDLDNDFDAIKMFITSSKNQIYTSSGATDYAINGQPFPTTQLVIPVVANLTTQGNYKISATQLQGLDNFNVSIKDNTTGFTADLKTTPDLLFTANAGTLTDRFSLIFSISTGIENPASSAGKFNIYTYNKSIIIIPLNDEWSGKTGNISILDLTGKIAGSLTNVEFQNNTPVQIQAPQAKGMYVVEIRSGMNRYTGKVVVR